MEKLNRLVGVVDNLNKICEKIIRKSVPVMKRILNDKEKLIAQFQEQHPNLDEKNIRKQLQEISLSFIADAKVVKRELDPFINNLLDGEKLSSSEGFFMELWSGDVYECEGIDALEELLKDLENQLLNCTLDYVMNKIN